MVISKQDKCTHDDYDRDYYDALKAEYADDPYVHICAREDYTVDETQIPWLYPNRGRDINSIRAQRATQSDKTQLTFCVEDQEGGEEHDDMFEDQPFYQSEMHTEKELEDFEKRARYCDPVSSRQWEDPMPESDFDPNMDLEFLPFRGLNADKLEKLQRETCEPIEVPAGSPKPQLARQLSSPEEERVNLQRSLDALQEMEANKPYDPVEMYNTEAPDSAEFARWQSEVERRGGNAVYNASYGLPPYKDPMRDLAERVEPNNPPLQYDALVDAHEGTWYGSATVYRLLNEERRFAPKPIRKRRLQTSVVLQEQEGGTVLTVETVFQGPQELLSSDDENHNLHNGHADGDTELLSEVEWSSSSIENALQPGRGVSADGCYITRPKPDTPHGPSLTISEGVLHHVIGDFEAQAILEFGVVSHSGSTENSALTQQGQRHRRRIFLICDAGAKSGKRKTDAPRFAYLLSVYEEMYEPGQEVEDIRDDEFLSSAMANDGCDVKKLLGDWFGTGILLHPEFPPDGVRLITTTYKLRHAPSGGLEESDVSWVDGERELPPQNSDVLNEMELDQQEKGEFTARRRVGRPDERGRKRSRRVAAAQAFDRSRLKTCKLLCDNVIHASDNGTMRTRAPDRSGWRVVSPNKLGHNTSLNKDRVLWMESPRLGRFVDDYVALVIDGEVLVEWPFTRASPPMWSTVSVTEVHKETRRRMVAGRNAEDMLVGALFVSETIPDQSESDAVVAYV